ncbi:glycosyl transferase family 1 [Mucilaginibacter sp. PAMC 26640]|nr:glycosyl transferase family 1 [Mucilaginibacter sp. PAMC 26640]
MAQQVDVCVFYTWGQQSLTKTDPGFGKTVTWDLDLLEGYNYVWLNNTAGDPGSHHFKGIINPDITHQIQNWQADAVLVIGWAYQSHLKVLRFFKGKIPVLFRGDSTLLDQQPGIKHILKSIFLTWVYNSIDFAFYNGINNKAYFTKYGLKEDQLIFAPHAIDNHRFGQPRKAEVSALRRQLHISTNHILILFAGKFEAKKDPLLLLNAFLKLTDKSCHLLFVGNGHLETELKRNAAGTDNIHFMDFQNQSYMPVIYQACDLFCLPSKGPGESWGLAVNEAMACEKAVLVSDKAGCAADLVAAGVNGYVFKNGDEADLLQYLTKLTQAGDVLERFGEQSGELIAGWNFQKVADTIVNQFISG